MTFKRLASVLWLAAMIILPSGCSRADASRGIESKTVSLVTEMAEFLKRPLAQRKLSNADSTKYVRLAQDKESDLFIRVTAIQTLAYANDKASRDALSALWAENKGVPLMGSVLLHSLRVRSNSDRSSQELYGTLAFHLGKSASPLERMFIANRLAIDFSEQGLWTILEAAKVETDERARCEMLYHLTQSKDKALLQETLNLSWINEDLLPTEVHAFLFGIITPNRSTDPEKNSSLALLRTLKKKLALPTAALGK